MAPKSSLRRLCLFRPQNQSMSQRCGFFNVPSWVMEFKPGTDWVRGWRNVSPGHSTAWAGVASVRGTCPPPWLVTPEEPGGTEGWIQMHSKLSMQFLSTSESNAPMERALLHSTSATCGESDFGQKPLTSSNDRWTFRRTVLDLWGLHIQINFH